MDFSSQANFEELARQVDIENFTSYVILNLWVLSLAWPRNNWYVARTGWQMDFPVLGRRMELGGWVLRS